MIAHASTATDIASGFIAKINEIILYPLITLMMGVALVVFLWGAFEFIQGAAEPATRAKGRQHILWGIIGMLVMVSALGILNIAAGTFGVFIY